MAYFLDKLSPKKELKKLEQRESATAHALLAATHNGKTEEAHKLLQKGLKLGEDQKLLKTIIKATDNLRTPPKSARKSPPRMAHKSRPVTPPSPRMSKAARRRTEALRAARDVPEGGRKTRRQRK
jgi:hypothetical protein